MQAAAERVQNSEHFGEAHRGLSAFQFDKEADADIGRCSQLILAQALGKPSLTNDGTNLFDGHTDVPDREYSPSAEVESPEVSRSGYSRSGNLGRDCHLALLYTAI